MHGKAQISLEFLIYIAIGISALAVSLYATAPVRNSYYANIYGASMNDFSSYIIEMQQYSSSEFSALVPKAVCSCTENGSVLECGNLSIKTGSRIMLANSVCEYSGGMENLSESYLGNGTFVISGSK